MRIRKRVYDLLHAVRSGDRAARAIETALLLLIVINILALILESIPALYEAHTGFFTSLDSVSIVIFTIEYILRVWSSVEHPAHQKPVTGRLRYMATPLAVIDLLAILPFYLAFLPVDLRFIRMIRLFRVFRLFKIARYVKALGLIQSVVYEKKEQIYLSIMFIIFLLIVISTLMFYIEHDAQPEVFSSIPASMWWGIETLTTVGYGDMLPVTPLGRALGGVISVLGIGLFALPAGILSSGLTEHLQKKEDRHRNRKCPHCGEDIS